MSKPLLQSTTQVNRPYVHWLKGVTAAVSNPLVVHSLMPLENCAIKMGT